MCGVSLLFIPSLLPDMKAAHARHKDWKFIIFILAVWDGGLGTVRFCL